MSGKGYRIHDQSGIYFLTFQVVEWIDIFTRKYYRDIFIDNLKYLSDQPRFKNLWVCNNEQSCSSYFICF